MESPARMASAGQQELSRAIPEAGANLRLVRAHIRGSVCVLHPRVVMSENTENSQCLSKQIRMLIWKI